MVFSSKVFLFLFLPMVLFLYYVPCRKNINLKNTILLLSSLFFYAWGEPFVVFLMVFSIAVNYIFGYLVTGRRKGLWLAVSVIFNLSFLFVFKYLNFALDTLRHVIDLDITTNIALPIGISFYTFQTMSYVIDVYRNTAKPQKSIFGLGLYVSMFPQLIAGPIVRYSTIENQILHRKESMQAFTRGTERFIIGLAKKMIVANNVGFVADTIYALEPSQISTAFAWLAAVAYSLQIYFDFSAYSDMAIGLGKMFGFEFEENFKYPYIANSVTDFWRRWHISLSTWFRDYVYIPLGGNRVSNARHIFNLFVTWLCTGIWHGANWTFIVWGLYYFIFLLLDKRLNRKPANNVILNCLRHVYTLLVVIVGWVLFRAESLKLALFYVKQMFSFDFMSFVNADFLWYIKNFVVVILIGCVFSTPIAKKIEHKLEAKNLTIVKSIVLLLLFAIALSFVFRSRYNPFIYFNF